ncbi:hypothetical protein ACLX1H_010114 [Fusarium chlamydosporum]
MAVPRRSKRIQALNQSNEGSPRLTESPEFSKEYHPEKRRKMTENQSVTTTGQLRGQELAEAIRISWNKGLEEKRAAEYRRRRYCEYLLTVPLTLEYLDGWVSEVAWPTLRGAVRSLMCVPSLWHVEWDSLDAGLQEKFLSYSPNVKELFGVYLGAQFVFTRWVWEIVDENFFSKKSKDIIWSSPYWEAQAAMESYLEEHNFAFDDNDRAIVKFPHWRFTSMDFYMALKDSPREKQRIDPACVVPIIAKALGRWFPEEYEKEPDAWSVDLEHLAREVVHMEFCFSANLTYLSHVFHHPITQQTCGFPYSHEIEGINGQAMRALHTNDSYKGRLVDFVYEPMLLQYGEHYGYDFHVKKAVYPMTVLPAYIEYFNSLPDEPPEEEEEENGEKSDEDDEDDEDDEESDQDKGEGEGITEEERKNNKNKENVDKEIPARAKSANSP